MKAIHKILLAASGAALLVALGVAVTFWAYDRIGEAAEMRKHTFVVLSNAEQLLSALKDAETGQRGYLLTGDETFLEPYWVARDNVGGYLRDLRQLALIGRAQQHLDALAPLIGARFLELSQLIELRRKHEMPAALEAVRSGRGKQFMDSIRAEMRSFIQIEESALAQHDAEFQANMRRLFALMLAGSLLTLLLGLSTTYALYRESQQRLRNLLHHKTQRLLEVEEDMNRQLQQANVALQDREQKLAVTLNSIGDAVIATNAKGRVTLMNPPAERLTGWTLAEVHGHPVDEFFRIVNQETRQPAILPIKKTLEQGTIQTIPYHSVLIARDKSECAIADTCAPIRNLGDQVVGAVLVFRDVTRENAAQQAVNDHAAQIETILNMVADGIITLQARGGIIETLNPAAIRMFGYAAEDLIGQYFSLLIPALNGDQRDGSLEYYMASDAARASGREREVVGQRKDGSFFPIEMTASEMWLNGQRYFISILRDISTRKQAEKAVLKTAAGESMACSDASSSSLSSDAHEDIL